VSRRAWLLAALATLASALAFALYARVSPPWHALGFVGLVPWLAALERAPSLRAALALGAAFSVAFSLAVFGWFAEAIAGYTQAPRALGYALLLCTAPLVQPQILVFAAVHHSLRRRGAGLAPTALAGASAWVGAEWALPRLFGDTIGHGLHASPWLRQGADLAGAHGLTFALVVVNVCVLAALGAASAAGTPRARARGALAPLACALGVVAALAAYGAWRVAQHAPRVTSAAPVTAGLVQADLSRYGHLAAELGTDGAVRLILDHHFGLSVEALARAELDLLVWPETVYPTTFGSPKSEAGAAYDREIAGFVAATGVPLVFGAYDAEAGAEYNAAILLEPAAAGPLSFASYRKASLFPLTERVPAWLESPWVRSRLPWLGTWSPGAGPEVLPLALPDGRSVRVAPLICYDAVDPAFAWAAARGGAELLITLSNDAWFAWGGGPRLHLVVSAFRSIETRLAQLRVTNTGISAVISPTGELLATAGVHERAALVGTVTPASPAATPVLAAGPWIGPGCAGLALALFLFARRLPPPPPPPQR
jgi:apolipoprotein N-acyltransferase